MFKQPKVRLGNKNYSQDELKNIRKENNKFYNNSVRTNKFNNQFTEFYHSTEWKKLRQQVLLRDNYMCQICFRNGVVNDKELIVHHITELKEDWSQRLNTDNLQTVCVTSHSRIQKVK